MLNCKLFIVGLVYSCVAVIYYCCCRTG